jgi:murein DD-endopeptidase MepM/ murein hydrolase activator NlpD
MPANIFLSPANVRGLGQMLRSKVFRGAIILAVLTLPVSGCTGTQYWMAPSAPPGAQAAVAIPSEQSGSSGTPLSPASTQTTGTPEPVNPGVPAPQVTSTAPGPRQENPTDSIPYLYYAQAADTLPVVATRFGVDASEITSAEAIPQTAYLTPGQLLIIPRRLGETTSPENLMPDSEVVYSPSAAGFDIEAYVEQAGGKLSTYTEWLKSSGLLNGAQVVERVATENSINPRLLLALLEYQSGWVYGQPKDRTAIDYPLGYVDPTEKGLYKQLVEAVNELSTGYYAYREGRLTDIRFPDGSTARLAPDLNAGTAAMQYYFAQHSQGQAWQAALDPQGGFPGLHTRMFGDPWERAQAVEPLFPTGLHQPPLSLPFTRGRTWSYTGGPHGAWERDGAYAAIDFAPGSTETGCVESGAWVTASSAGLVVRSDNGVVALDLDGDGREQTGWVLIYLHLAEEDRIEAGQLVDKDDMLGHPSCEGGLATGTHLHIARKFNGEWIPADGPLPFNLGGWIAHAGEQPYLGTLTRDGQTITACTCSNAATAIERGENDP